MPAEEQSLLLPRISKEFEVSAIIFLGKSISTKSERKRKKSVLSRLAYHPHFLE